jgi:hypothetical protein
MQETKTRTIELKTHQRIGIYLNHEPWAMSTVRAMGERYTDAVKGDKPMDMDTAIKIWMSVTVAWTERSMFAGTDEHRQMKAYFDAGDNLKMLELNNLFIRRTATKVEQEDSGFRIVRLARCEGKNELPELAWLLSEWLWQKHGRVNERKEYRDEVFSMPYPE